MKRVEKSLKSKLLLLSILVLATSILLFAGLLVLTLRNYIRKVQPETYASALITDREHYRDVNSIEADKLGSFAYAYDENVFVDALRDKSTLPNVADEQGRIPAFKLGDDVFVITHKWVNDSNGLAISDDKDFVAKIEGLENAMYVSKLDGNLYR